MSDKELVSSTPVYWLMCEYQGDAYQDKKTSGYRRLRGGLTIWGMTSKCLLGQFPSGHLPGEEKGTSYDS